MIKKVMCVAVLLMMCGCANWTRSAKIPGTYPLGSDPDKVEVMYQFPQRSYQVVGVVEMDKGEHLSRKPSKFFVERDFRIAASKLGADAVVIEVFPFYSGDKGQGKAIRWNN
jgi:hypothetical protein